MFGRMANKLVRYGVPGGWNGWDPPPPERRIGDLPARQPRGAVPGDGIMHLMRQGEGLAGRPHSERTGATPASWLRRPDGDSRLAGRRRPLTRVRADRWRLCGASGDPCLRALPLRRFGQKPEPRSSLILDGVGEPEVESFLAAPASSSPAHPPDGVYPLGRTPSSTSRPRRHREHAATDNASPPIGLAGGRSSA